MYKASYRYRCECCYCLAGWQSDINSSQDLFLPSDHFLHFLCPCGALELRDLLVFTSEIRPYLLTVSRDQGDWSQSSLCRQFALCVCACFPRAPPPTPSTSPHVMPVTWFPGTQSSKSESDFIFNHSKSTAPCFSPLYLHFPLNPVHHLPRIWSNLQHYLLTARGAVFGKEALCSLQARFSCPRLFPEQLCPSARLVCGTPVGKCSLASQIT